MERYHKWFDTKMHPMATNPGIYLFTVEIEESGETSRMTLSGILVKNKNYPHGWQVCTYGYPCVFHDFEEKTDTGCNRLLAWAFMPDPYGIS